MGGPTTSPDKSKMADGSHIEFHKNANISRYLHTVLYKDTTRSRLDWTTAARRLSAYSIVESVVTTTTSAYNVVGSVVTTTTSACNVVESVVTTTTSAFSVIESVVTTTTSAYNVVESVVTTTTSSLICFIPI